MAKEKQVASLRDQVVKLKIQVRDLKKQLPPKLKRMELMSQDVKANDILIGKYGGRSKVVAVTPYNHLMRGPVVITEHGTIYPTESVIVVVETRRRKF